MAEFAPVPVSDPLYTQSTAIDALTIGVTDRVENLREEWLNLQGTGIATPYQSYDWVETWQTAVSDKTGEELRIVTIRDDLGTLLAILPLAISRSWGATVAKWVSNRLINYGMPVMTPEFSKTVKENPFQFLRRIGEAVPGVDALHLGYQPKAWDGVGNPLAETFTDMGANRTYLTNLPADYEALYTAKRSKSTRRNNRRRTAKLEGYGEIGFGLPKDSHESTHVLQTLFRFVRDRLGKQGIKDPYGDEGTAFYTALAQLPADAPLQLRPYFLRTGDEIVAVNMGAEYKGRFCGLICSIIDGPQTTHSPGDLALRKTIQTCCETGIKVFDFSAGDSPYKLHWADRTVQLAETVFPITGAGYGYAALVLPQLSTKRIIKNSDWLWSMAQRARKIAAPMITRKSA